MKRFLWVAALLVASTYNVQAQTGPIFDYIPDGYHLEQGNGGQPGPIFDERGFYAGYYRPRPARQIQPEVATPAPAPQPQPTYNYQDVNMGSYNGGYNAGGGYGYGYGGYYGYGSYGSCGRIPQITNPLGVSPGGFPSAAGIPFSPTAPFVNTSSTHSDNHSSGGGNFSNSSGGHFPAPSGGGHASAGEDHCRH